MGEVQEGDQTVPQPPGTSRESPNPPPVSRDPHIPPPPPPAAPRFDPSRMIGIIKRKALIKDLAALYHSECLTCCQELLELQKKRDEPYIEIKTPNNLRKETTRPSKRVKKSR